MEAVKNKRDFVIANNLEEVEAHKPAHAQLDNPEYEEHFNNDVDIPPQMLASNELRDSLILQDQQRRQRENDREEVKLQQERPVSNFLWSGNDVTLEMPFED